jgi:hypothetical protein
MSLDSSNDYKTQDAMNEHFSLLTREYEPIYFCRTNLTPTEIDSGRIYEKFLESK